MGSTRTTRPGGPVQAVQGISYPVNFKWMKVAGAVSPRRLSAW